MPPTIGARSSEPTGKKIFEYNQVQDVPDFSHGKKDAGEGEGEISLEFGTPKPISKKLPRTPKKIKKLAEETPKPVKQTAKEDSDETAEKTEKKIEKGRRLGVSVADKFPKKSAQRTKGSLAIGKVADKENVKKQNPSTPADAVNKMDVDSDASIKVYSAKVKAGDKKTVSVRNKAKTVKSELKEEAKVSAGGKRKKACPTPEEETNEAAEEQVTEEEELQEKSLEKSQEKSPEETEAPRSSSPPSSCSFFEKLQQGLKAYFSSRNALLDDKNKKKFAEGGIHTRGGVGKGIKEEHEGRKSAGKKLKIKKSGCGSRVYLSLGGQSHYFTSDKSKIFRHYRKLTRKKLYNPKKHYVTIQIPRKGYFYRSVVHFKAPGPRSLAHNRMELNILPKNESETQICRVASSSSKESIVFKKRLKTTLRRSRSTTKSRTRLNYAVEQHRLSLEKTKFPFFTVGSLSCTNTVTTNRFTQNINQYLATNWPEKSFPDKKLLLLTNKSMVIKAKKKNLDQELLGLQMKKKTNAPEFAKIYENSKNGTKTEKFMDKKNLKTSKKTSNTNKKENLQKSNSSPKRPSSSERPKTREKKLTPTLQNEKKISELDVLTTEKKTECEFLAEFENPTSTENSCEPQTYSQTLMLQSIAEETNATAAIIEMFDDFIFGSRFQNKGKSEEMLLTTTISASSTESKKLLSTSSSVNIAESLMREVDFHLELENYLKTIEEWNCQSSGLEKSQSNSYYTALEVPAEVDEENDKSNISFFTASSKGEVNQQEGDTNFKTSFFDLKHLPLKRNPYKNDNIVLATLFVPNESSLEKQENINEREKKKYAHECNVIKEDYVWHNEYLYFTSWLSLLIYQVSSPLVLYTKLVFEIRVVLSSCFTSEKENRGSTTSKVLFKNEECSLSNESFKSYVASDSNQDQTEELSDFSDEKNLNPDSSTSVLKPSSRNSRRSPSPTIPEVIDIYNSILKENIKIRRTFFNSGSNKRCMSPSIISFLNRKLLEKKQKKDLLKFSKSISHKITNSMRFRRTKTDKRKNIMQLEKYVSIFQRILKSTLSINQIAKINAILADFKNFSSKPHEELSKCESHAAVLNTPNVSPDKNSKEEEKKEKKKTDEVHLSPTVAETQNENLIKKPNLIGPKAESSKLYLRGKTKSKISNVLECIHVKNNKLEKEKNKPKEKKETEYCCKTKEKVKKNKNKSQSLRGFEFTRPAEFVAVMRCLNSEGKKRRRMKKRNLAKKVMMSVNLSGDKVLVEKVWRFSNENLLNLIPVTRSNQESNISDLIVEHISDKNVKKRFLKNTTSNETEKNSLDTEKLSSTTTLKKSCFVSEKTLHEIPEEILTDDEKKGEEEVMVEEEHFQGKIINDEAEGNFEEKVISSEESKFFEEMFDFEETMINDEEGDDNEECSEIKHGSSEGKMTSEKEVVESSGRDKIQADPTAKSSVEQNENVSNFEYNQELLKTLHPIDLIVEKSESKIGEENEVSEKISEIQCPLALKINTKHKLSPKIKKFLEQVLNKTFSEKKSTNIQNISIFNMNKSKSFTIGPEGSHKNTLIISRPSAKTRLKSPAHVKSMEDTSTQKVSKPVFSRKKNWQNLPVRPHTAIICYPSYNLQDNKFSKSKKNQRELKDRKFDIKVGNAGPNRSKEPISQKYGLGQRKKSEEIFKRPQNFADLRKQKSDTGNNVKPEHVVRNSSPCTSGVVSKPRPTSGNQLPLKTSAETILFLDTDLSPGCCSVEFIFNNTSEPPSIHSDASSKNSTASCAAEAFKTLAAQRLLSTDGHSSSKNIAEAHSPYVMIHSESFLKNCKEPSVHVQNFSESKCSNVFYPGKAQENSNDESPLVTFVLTPNQYKNAEISKQQVKIVQKQKILTNVENASVVEKKGGKETEKKKIMREEKKEDEKDNIDFWTNCEEVEGGLTLDSIEKFIDFLSKKTASSNKFKEPPNKANERHKYNSQKKKPQPCSRPKCNSMTCRKSQYENNFRVKTKKEIAYETWVPVEIRPLKEMLNIKRMKLRGKKIQIEKAADKAVQVQNPSDEESIKKDEIQTNNASATDNTKNSVSSDSEEQSKLSLIADDDTRGIAEPECEIIEEKQIETETLEENKEDKSKAAVTTTAINPFTPEILRVLTNAINSASNIHNKNEIIEIIEKVANTFNNSKEHEKPAAGDAEQNIIEEKLTEKVEKPAESIIERESEILSEPINDAPKKVKTYKIKIQCITRTSSLKTEIDSLENSIEPDEKSIELKSDELMPLEESKETENDVSNFSTAIDPKEVLTKKPSTYFDAEELANGDHEISSQTKENSLGIIEERNEEKICKKKFPTSLTIEDISLLSGDFLCKEKEDILFRKIVKNLQVNNVYYAILLMEGWLKKAEEQKNKRKICAPKIQALLTLIENKSKSLILVLEKNNWKKILLLLEEALQVIKEEDQRLAFSQLKSILENIGNILEKIQNVKGKSNEIENHCTQGGDVKTKPSDGLGSLVLKIRASFSEIKNRVVTNWNKKLRDYRNEPDIASTEADGDFPYSVHSTQNMFEIPLEFSENQTILFLQPLKKQVRQQRLQIQNFKSVNSEIQEIKNQVASKMMSLEIILSSLSIIQENDIPGPSEECLRKEVEDSFLNFENNNGLFLNQSAETGREGRLDLKKKVKDLRAPSIMRSLVKVWDTRSFPGSFSSVF